eukprot:TRINITY_DN2015_c0_g1_i3.p1 TRINITY_DN2015_c0_g1~~TRINITY_DN2015_c0_g1_i3.p1  ORF type:complete len:542 (-),score=93.21 TRINITY_DN2015_c0_g1_i3:1-1626(-)
MCIRDRISMRVTVLLIVLGAASALHCNKLQPSYEPHEIPPHTGLSGPFGTVCEVRSAGDLPTIPEPPGEAPWAVQSRFPDTFMEVLNASQPPPVALVASAARDVPCGGYTVRRAGVVMDEKVYGIHTGWASWEMACQACGKALEPSIGPGWYCQTNGSPRTATGVWLKRALRSTVDVVSIDAAATRQSIVGWGGAITDAVAAAAKLLPAELQTAWLGLYYGGTGAGYSVARVPLGGTDFSQRAYSLDDQPAGQEDLTLSRMCLQDEGGLCGQDHKIPLVQEALSRETGTKLFLSPWSPPAWMKTTGKLTGGALKGVDSNSSTYVQAWVESYIKYLEQWEAHNVSFWGLTVQNEPGADQFVSWNSMALTGPEERVLVEQLGPLIKQKYPGIKIMVHDDQIYSIESRLQHTGLLSSDLVDGVAYHWYGSVGGSYQNTSAITVGSLTIPVGGGVLVKSVYEQLIKGTGKFMLATEACNGAVTGLIQTLVDKNSESNNRGVRPGDWYRGVRYSRDAVSYTHLRAHETVLDLVCRLLLEKKKKKNN